MPYRVHKIPVLDQDERKALGVRLPFSSPSVFMPTYQTIEAYKTNLLLFLMTGKQERYFNVTLGNGLLNQLFEQYTEEKRRFIEDQLREEIQYYFPKLKINKIELTGNPDGNLAQLSMNFEIKDTLLSDDLIISFE